MLFNHQTADEETQKCAACARVRDLRMRKQLRIYAKLALLAYACNIEIPALVSSELISLASRIMAVQGDVEGEDMLAEWSRDLEAVLYEQEVEEAIREVCPPFTTAPLESFLLPPVVQVCPTSDPLDSKDFDAIDYINQLFPTEQVRLSCINQS